MKTVPRGKRAGESEHGRGEEEKESQTERRGAMKREEKVLKDRVGKEKQRNVRVRHWGVERRNRRRGRQKESPTRTKRGERRQTKR